MRTSARQATSLAVRHSARSRAPGYQPAKPARPGRSSSVSKCGAEMSAVSRLIAATGLSMIALGRQDVAESPVSAGSRNVLAVHWGAEDFSTTPIVNAAIREAVSSASTARIGYYAEYLESDRFPEEAATLAFRDYIRRKYHDRRIAAVVTNADPALRFVLRYRKELFPHAPVVFIGNAIPPVNVLTTPPGMT